MKDKKVFIIILLIIAFIISLMLMLNNHQRDTPIDINTCSQQELESLPEIGEILAIRIIDNRPYSNIWELDNVKGIGQKTIKTIKDKVVAK